MRQFKFRAWSKSLNKMDYSNLNAISFKGDIYYGNADITGFHDEIMQYSGLKDRAGIDIYENDIVEIIIDENETRRFVVKIKTVVREVVSHPSFIEDTAKVAITGVVFEWEGFELFPCVDENGVHDNEKMMVVGNVFENPELLQ